MDSKSIAKAVEACLAAKKPVKFTQSIDLAINVDVDFKKPENRVNLDVVLPHAVNDVKVAVFADGDVAFNAKPVVDLIIPGSDVPKYAADKKLQKELLQYSILAAPNLMVQIAKSLGQVLGTAGKLPKPILPNANIKDLVEKTKKSIVIKSKGKYLPTLNCIVGRENMPVEKIVENILAILEQLNKKIPDSQLKTIYLKTTMGKAVRVAK